MRPIDVHADNRFAYVFTKPYTLMAAALGGQCLVAWPLSGEAPRLLGNESGYGLASDAKRLYFIRDSSIDSLDKPLRA